MTSTYSIYFQKTGRVLHFYGELLILCILGVVVRLITTPNTIESFDSLFFVRGVLHYDVEQMQPHWPGYPVYIWLGKLLHLFYNDPVKALHTISAVSSALCAIPLALLVRSWSKVNGASSNVARIAGFVTGTIWLLTPISWIDGTEIFSDPIALLVALFVLLCCWYYNLSLQWSWLTVASVLAGLLLGIRLSYVFLLVPLMYVWWQARGRKAFRASFVWFSMSVLVWLTWQFLMNPSSFIAAGERHLEGHFTSWGGSAVTKQLSLKLIWMFFKTFSVYGIGWWDGQSAVRLAVMCLTGVLFLVGVYVLLKRSKRSVMTFVALWSLPYLVWLMVAHDVSLARYYFPLVADFCLMVGLALPAFLSTKWGFQISTPGLALTISLMAASVVPLAFEHGRTPSLDMQLATYARTLPKSILADNFPADLLRQAPQVQSLIIPGGENNVLAETQHYRVMGAPIYATSRVLGTVPQRDWLPVVRFCINPLLRSRGLHELILYKYQKDFTTQPSVLPCAEPERG
jgi:Protein of unknown function (DUF2723)